MTEKSLTKNSLYNVVYKSLNVVFPLITTMYISRILLPSGVGRVATAQNIATYFTLIVALGLPTYGVKLIAESTDNPSKLSRNFSALFVINYLSTLVCSIAYYSLLFSLDALRGELKLYMIMGLPIVFNVFNIDWFYQGIEEYKYIMNRSILVKVVCFLAMIIFVRSSADYLIYAFILTLGTILNYIFNVANLRGKVKFELKGLEISRHIKPVFVLLAASLAIEVYSLMGVTILNPFCGEEAVAYYSNSLKGIKIIKNFITSVCTAFLPRMSFYFQNGQSDDFKKLSIRGIKILLYFAVPASLGCIAVSESLVAVLFGMEFIPASTTIVILAPTIVTIAISNFVGYQVLVVTGHERFMLFATGCGAIINIILNLIFIPTFRHNGAAFATTVTETIVAVMQYAIMVKYLRIKVDRKYWADVMLSGLLMFIVVYLCHSIGNNIVLKCTISVTVGIGMYAILTVISRNEVATAILVKIKGFIAKK